jgi:hypothetical protein
VPPFGQPAGRTHSICIFYRVPTFVASSHLLISLSNLFARLLWCFRRFTLAECPTKHQLL